MENHVLNCVWLTRAFACGLMAAAVFSCAPVSEQPEAEAVEGLNNPPGAVIHAIEKTFPGAVPYQRGIDSLVKHLQRFGIPPESMLWGQSTCVDDIINTKNKLNSGIKGPFNFGGLAGLPFTGVTGLDAFGHHVPENGAAILFVGPHIGYNEKEGWGKILRHNQQHPSTCCGALYAAIDRLKKGTLEPGTPAGDDYQEQTIEQLAYAHREELLASPDPLVAFTQLTYREAIHLLSDYASRIKERHFKYAVVVGGVIVNTDHTYADYVWIDRIAVLDVHNNVWVVGEKPTE